MYTYGGDIYLLNCRFYNVTTKFGWGFIDAYQDVNVTSNCDFNATLSSGLIDESHHGNLSTTVHVADYDTINRSFCPLVYLNITNRFGNFSYLVNVTTRPDIHLEFRDLDHDGILDELDDDIDGDGWNNTVEDQAGTDPANASSVPPDLDMDGIPDPWDNDVDGDGWNNTMENMAGSDSWDNASVPADMDGDGIIDLMDQDRDGDGVENVVDAFPENATEWNDTDLDGIGDNSDIDIDGDGWNNTVEDLAGSDPLDPDSLPPDLDGDGTPDILDEDRDGDGIPDDVDLFPDDPLEFNDRDLDGVGDRADTDDDGDGWNDTEELMYGSDPFDNFSVPSDLDGDRTPDVFDNDTDGDGVDDLVDAFPRNASEWNDTDMDGVGDNSDNDIDGDGYLNVFDCCPFDALHWLMDIDDPTDENRTDSNKPGSGDQNATREDHGNDARAGQDTGSRAFYRTKWFLDWAAAVSLAVLCVLLAVLIMSLVIHFRGKRPAGKRPPPGHRTVVHAEISGVDHGSFMTRDRPRPARVVPLPAPVLIDIDLEPDKPQLNTVPYDYSPSRTLKTNDGPPGRVPPHVAPEPDTPLLTDRTGRE